MVEVRRVSDIVMAVVSVFKEAMMRLICWCALQGKVRWWR